MSCHSLSCGALLALLSGPLLAEPVLTSVVQPRERPAAIRFYSVSESSPYALVVTAPRAAACRAVRYRIFDSRSRMLGESRSLGPGEVQVVRMGPGFARGSHALRVEALASCAEGLPHPRPVRLNRPGPGHMLRPL